MQPNTTPSQLDVLVHASARGLEAEQELFASKSFQQLAAAFHRETVAQEAISLVRQCLDPAMTTTLQRHGITVNGQAGSEAGLMRVAASIAAKRADFLRMHTETGAHRSPQESAELQRQKDCLLDVGRTMRAVAKRICDFVDNMEKDLIQPNIALMERGDDARIELNTLRMRMDYEQKRHASMPQEKPETKRAETTSHARKSGSESFAVGRRKSGIIGDAKSFIRSFDPPLGTAAIVPAMVKSEFPGWITALDAGPTNQLLCTLEDEELPQRELRKRLANMGLKDVRIDGVTGKLRDWSEVLEQYKQPEPSLSRVQFNFATVGMGQQG